MATVIETARLTLRSWSPEDLREAFGLWSDPQVMADVGAVHENLERTRQALEGARQAEKRDGVCLWRLARRQDDEPLGCCGFHRYEGPGSTRAGTSWLELAYHLRPSAWGHGYATEAARSCVQWARPRGFTHVVAFATIGNDASHRVLDKLGFVHQHTTDGQTSHQLVLQSPLMGSAKSMAALVDEMLADGKLTREELKRFEAEMLADGQLSVDERKQIDRLLQAIANGEVTVVDG